MTEWLRTWVENDWKNSSGNPVINREDFECLLNEKEGIEINWVCTLICFTFNLK